MSVGPDSQDRHQEPDRHQGPATGEGAAVGDVAAPGEDPGPGARQRHRQGVDRDLDPEDWAAVPVNGDERLLRERPPHW
jgi:hypothetical protein